MTRRLRVEADGGSRGNPGPAAYGAVVKDAVTGVVLADDAATIGIASNNVAEYRGLIAGLRAAHAVDPEADVEVAMDSKLVVEQMTGRWKIRHPDMRKLAAQARTVLPESQVSYRWVPREANADADRLVNAALDGTYEGAADVGTDVLEQVDVRNHLVGWAPPSSSVTTTLLLRHGATKHTVAKRFSGSGGDDPGLSDVGRDQASHAAAFVARHQAVAAVMTSPLRRTVETAHIVGEVLGCEVLVDDDLRECDFGRWDGHTFAEVQQNWPDELRAWLTSTSVAPPGGESFDEVEQRVRRVRGDVVDRFPEASVVVVTHVTPIKTLVRLALDAPPHALFRMELRPASLSSIAWFADGNASLRAFNDTSYLDGEPWPHLLGQG